MHPPAIRADLLLAQRLEAALAYEGAAYVAAWQRLDPAAGATAESLAGGILLFTGVDSPVTQAVGLGMTGPVSGEEISRLLEFFESRQALPRVSLCPLAHPSLLLELGREGFYLEEFENVLVCPLHANAAEPSADRHGGDDRRSEVEVRRVGTDEHAVWTRVMIEALLGDPVFALAVHGGRAQEGGGAEPVAADRVLAAAPPHIHDTECYLAWVGGIPAGGGAVSIHHGIGTLFSDATLPAFRGRGVQSALIGARVGRAVEAGCELAVSGTAPGGTSQRNFERRGFHVVYTDVMLAAGPSSC